MERRYVTFIIFAGLILIAQLLVNNWLNPRAPQVANNQQENQPEAKQAEAPPAAADAVEAQPADEAKPADAKPAAEPSAAAADNQQEPDEKIPVQRISLGSYLSTSGYRLLATLNNQGAAVERLELTSPQYRDLENRSGYLGHLAPADAPAGGCLVQVVGRGTPADTAGLKPGDTITMFGSKAVTRAADLIDALGETEAGQTVSVAITRDGRKTHGRGEARSPAAGDHPARTG